MKLATIKISFCGSCPNFILIPNEYPTCKLTKGTGVHEFRQIIHELDEQSTVWLGRLTEKGREHFERSLATKVKP